MFRDLFDRMGYTDDNEFDWTGKTMVIRVLSLDIFTLTIAFLIDLKLSMCV